jgi:hypothetical protein
MKTKLESPTASDAATCSRSLWDSVAQRLLAELHASPTPITLKEATERARRKIKP